MIWTAKYQRVQIGHVELEADSYEEAWSKAESVKDTDVFWKDAEKPEVRRVWKERVE